MHKIITLCLSLFLLTSCGTEEPQNLKHFTSPFGGKYAVRIPDQTQVTENSFIYQVKIENVENDYFEIKRFPLERMNFHPFTPTFKPHQLEFLHFEYFTIPLKQRQAAYDYLADWDAKITNNPTLFKVTNQLTFATCQKQQLPDDKLVTTIFRRLNENGEFIKIYDDLEAFKNLTIPNIAYQKIC